MEIPGGGENNAKPSGTENPVGWGVELEKNPLWRGHGHFLEPHNVSANYLGILYFAAEVNSGSCFK